METVLLDRCGVRPDNLRVLLDPQDPFELGSALTVVADQATDVLLIYYVGHGLVSAGNELYLATSATDDPFNGLAYKALSYQALRDSLSTCAAKSIIVVLDCCFAGRAHGSLGTAANDAFELAALGGTYVLASSSRDEQALAPAGEKYTAFTGELMTLLREGDPAGLSELTIEYAYHYLRRVLPQRGLPAPERHLSGQAGNLVLASNPAAVPPPARSPTGDVTVTDPVEQPCPYRGLDSFTADDARFFFGRDRLISDLVDQVAVWASDGSPIALVGPSGVGKSSLLRAGLIPAIERGKCRLPGSRTWPHMVLTPGEHPLDTLAARLAQPSGMTTDAILADLRADPSRLVGIVRQALRRRAGGRDVRGGRLLLVVDQFEELFTACQDGDERRMFIEAICAAGGHDADSAEFPVLVVVGLRADFYGHCMAYPELVSVLKDRQIPVAPMNLDEMLEAIERPAAAVGLGLEDGLADLLLHDLRVDHDFAGGTLPLLSYALLLTWGRREGRTLTMAGYAATGGIWNAVTHEADRVYDGLDPVGQRAVRLMLLRMVRIGEGTEDTRRHVSLADLIDELPDADTTAVVRARDALANARLITVDGDTAQITHEALLRAWRRLRDWIDDDRAGLLVQQKLIDDASGWEQAGRNPGELYRDSRLEVARGWADDHPGQLGALAQEFLDASASAERSRRRVRAGVIAGLASMLVVSLVATVLAVIGRSDALARQRAVISGGLVSRAEAAYDNAPQLALMLGIAADRIQHDPGTTAGLVSGLVAPYAATLAAHTNTVAAVTFSRDGRMLASGSLNSTMLWDTSELTRPRKLGELSSHSGWVNSLAFNADGHVLATGNDNAVILWDISNSGQPRQIGQPLTVHTGSVDAVAFSPDGRILASGSADNSVILWDTSNPAQPRQLTQLRAHTGAVGVVAFSPDGRMLASGSADNSVILWDISNPAQPRHFGQPLTGHTDLVAALAFSPDGRMLASGGGDSSVILWDTSDRSKSHAVSHLGGHTSPVRAVQFDRDGRRVSAAGADHAVISWDVTDPARPRQTGSELGGHTNWSLAVAFAPDRALATGSADNTVILWNYSSPAQLPTLARFEHSDAVRAVAFSRDGQVLASGSADNTVKLWDVSNPHQRNSFSKLSQLAGHTGWVDAVAFNPDGQVLATGSEDGTAILWNISNLTAPRRIGQPLPGKAGAAVTAVAFSPNGHVLATASGNAVTLWDATDPSRVRTLGELTGHHGLVNAVAFSPDGRTLATGAGDGTAILWDTSNPDRAHQIGQPLTGHTNWVTTVAFSPDGHSLATGSLDSSVIVWNIADPSRPRRRGVPLAYHNSWVRAVAFSPDGRTLASVSNDQSMILWDTADQEQPRRLSRYSAHADAVLAVAFSPSGQMVATGGGDHIVNLRDTTALNDLRDHAVDRACQRAGRGLNPDEWARYVRDLPYENTCPRQS